MSPSEKQEYQPLDAKEYAETFNTFIACSSEYAEMLKLVKPVIDSFGNLSVDLLSIGAGTLCFERDMVTNLGLKIRHIDAIEPNEKHLAELNEEMSKLSLEHTVHATYFTTKFSSKKKFDMILMSHCMYCMEDPIGAMLHAKSLLKPDGKLVIFNQAEKGGYELYQRFCNTASLRKGYINDHKLSSKELVVALNNNAVEHQVEYGPSVMEVDDFIGCRDTPTANHVVSFLLQTRYEDIDEELQKEIYEMVKEGSLAREDGKFVFEHPTAMIVIK